MSTGGSISVEVGKPTGDIIAEAGAKVTDEKHQEEEEEYDDEYDYREDMAKVKFSDEKYFGKAMHPIVANASTSYTPIAFGNISNSSFEGEFSGIVIDGGHTPWHQHWMHIVTMQKGKDEYPKIECYRHFTVDPTKMVAFNVHATSPNLRLGAFTYHVSFEYDGKVMLETDLYIRRTEKEFSRFLDFLAKIGWYLN